jgi:signal transduction histidine kinase
LIFSKEDARLSSCGASGISGVGDMGMSYDELRVLAAKDPRAARTALGTLFDSGSENMKDILERASAPGEGRIRQLIANLARTRKDRDGVTPTLLRWLGHETDEFARTALLAATEGVDASRWTPPRNESSKLVDIYRYVGGRLCHRVRNALPSSLTQAKRISQAAVEAPEPLRTRLIALASELTDELRGLGRLVEFDEGDEYFRWRDIVAMQWLPTYARAFAERNGELAFTATCDGTGAKSAVVMASEYYLDILFWNLFKNAQQAVEGPVTVTVVGSICAGKLAILCADNGPGFSESLADGAFEDRISTKPTGRGRGLLEIADAVHRLSGSVRLVHDHAGALRVQVTLPVTHV